MAQHITQTIDTPAPTQARNANAASMGAGSAAPANQIAPQMMTNKNTVADSPKARQLRRQPCGGPAFTALIPARRRVRQHGLAPRSGRQIQYHQPDWDYMLSWLQP